MANGDPILVYDNTSIAKFGPQAHALGWPNSSLLLTQDGDVHRLVTAVLNQQKDDFLGISSMDLDADQDPVHMYGTLAAINSRGIGTTAKLTAHFVHPSGSTVDQDLRVIGVHSVITMEGQQAKWTCQVRTAANSGVTSSAVDWETATAYFEDDIVSNGGELYVCTLAHTSGTDEDEPGVGAEWPDFWDNT